jgi:hypothetical protein
VVGGSVAAVQALGVKALQGLKFLVRWRAWLAPRRSPVRVRLAPAAICALCGEFAGGEAIGHCANRRPSEDVRPCLVGRADGSRPARAHSGHQDHGRGSGAPDKNRVMAVKRIKPNILSERFDESRAFYNAVIGLEGAMGLTGSSSSGPVSSAKVQLSVMKVVIKACSSRRLDRSRRRGRGLQARRRRRGGDRLPDHQRGLGAQTLLRPRPERGGDQRHRASVTTGGAPLLDRSSSGSRAPVAVRVKCPKRAPPRARLQGGSRSTLLAPPRRLSGALLRGARRVAPAAAPP